MSQSNWRLVAAVGTVGFITLLIAVLTWPQIPALQPYNYESPRSEGYRPGGASCGPTALAAIREIRKRMRQADACNEKAEEYRLKTNELIQQTRSADATKAQSDIASQGLWTAWFQTIGGFITLSAAIAAAIYARDAATQGKRAADAARDGLDQSVRAFEGDNRSWLVVDSFIVTGIRAGSTTHEGETFDIIFLDYQVVVKNIGRAPAIRHDVSVVHINPGSDNHMDFREQRLPVYEYPPMIDCLAPSETRPTKRSSYRKIDDLVQPDPPPQSDVIPQTLEQKSVLPQVGIVVRYQAAVGPVCETRQIWNVGLPQGEGVKPYIRGELRPGVSMPAAAVLQRTFVMT